MKLFTKINDFLTDSVDYMELRVPNGKFIGDLNDLEQRLRAKAHDKINKSQKAIQTSPTLKKVRAAIQKQWEKIIKIPVIGEILFILVRGLFIILRSFIDYGIIVSLSWLTFLALLENFQTSALIFALMTLPILWINGLLHGLLFFMIDKRERHESTTLVSGIQKTFEKLSSFVVLICLHVFTLFTIAIFFILTAFTISEIFEALRIGWERSFEYWIMVVPLGLLTLITMYVFNIVAYQSYFWVVTGKQKPFHALRSAWKFFKHIPFQLTFFHLIILGLSTAAIPHVYNTYSVFGITALIFFYGHISMLVSYVLRQQYLETETVDEKHTKHEHGIFLALFGLGSVTFFLSSLLFIRQYPIIQNYIWRDQQRNNFVSQVVLYENPRYGYQISYPKSWSVYQFDTEPDVPTIYNNYSGNREGGIWLKITVQDEEKTNYTELQSRQAGLVITDSQTKTVLTKVENITWQGYPGLKYIYSIPEGSNQQYQTHYMINNHGKVYDIIFITVSKIVDNENAELFDNILSTFKFVE